MTKTGTKLTFASPMANVGSEQEQTFEGPSILLANEQARHALSKRTGQKSPDRSHLSPNSALNRGTTVGR